MPLVRFTASAIDASSSGDVVFLRLFVMRPNASALASADPPTPGGDRRRPATFRS